MLREAWDQSRVTSWKAGWQGDSLGTCLALGRAETKEAADFSTPQDFFSPDCLAYRDTIKEKACSPWCR